MPYVHPGVARSTAGLVERNRTGLDDLTIELDAAGTACDAPDLIAPIRTHVNNAIEVTTLLAATLRERADWIEAVDSGLPLHVADLYFGSHATRLGEFLAGDPIDPAEHFAYDADDFRRTLEARHPGHDPAGIMEQLLDSTPAATAFFWQTLSPAERVHLARTRPELVVYGPVANGAQVSDQERIELARANLHTEFSTEFLMDIGASIGIGKRLSVDLGGSTRAIIERLSNGHLQVTVGEGFSGGVSAGADAEQGSVSAGIAAFTERSQVFMFDDEATVADMIDGLRAAAKQNSGFGQFFWNAGDFVAGPWINQDNPIERKLKEIGEWDSRISSTEEYGLELSAGGEAEIDLGVLEAEIEGSANVSMSYYDTDIDDGADTDLVDHWGVVMAASASYELEAEGRHIADGQLTGNVSATVDYRVNSSGDDQVLLLFEAEAGLGAAVEILELDGVDEFEFETHAAATSRSFIEIDIAVNDATRGDVGDAMSRLASGQIPAAELADLYRAADITMGTWDGTVVTHELEVDAKVVSVNGEMSEGNYRVTDLHRKPAGSTDTFSVLDLQRRIDALS